MPVLWKRRVLSGVILAACIVSLAREPDLATFSVLVLLFIVFSHLEKKSARRIDEESSLSLEGKIPRILLSVFFLGLLIYLAKILLFGGYFWL